MLFQFEIRKRIFKSITFTCHNFSTWNKLSEKTVIVEGLKFCRKIKEQRFRTYQNKSLVITDNYFNARLKIRY